MEVKEAREAMEGIRGNRTLADSEDSNNRTRDKTTEVIKKLKRQF
jgi:hypothetical protein